MFIPLFVLNDADLYFFFTTFKSIEVHVVRYSDAALSGSKIGNLARQLYLLRRLNQQGYSKLFNKKSQLAKAKMIRKMNEKLSEKKTSKKKTKQTAKQ